MVGTESIRVRIQSADGQRSVEGRQRRIKEEAEVSGGGGSGVGGVGVCKRL